MSRRVRLSLLTAMLPCFLSSAGAQTAPAPTKFKDELRMPWQRGGQNFLRLWLVAGPFACGLETDCLGGETAIHATDGLEQKRAETKWG